MKIMQTHWLRTATGCLLVSLLMALLSCHEEPALPNTLIPYQCRVARVEVIDTTSRSITSYEYDKAGNLTKLASPSGTIRTYTYDGDGYLIKTEDGSNTLTYQYDSNTKLIKEISGGSLRYTYTYEGSNLKTYTVLNGTATTTYTYAGRQLSEVKATSGDTYKVQNGKIVQHSYTGGAVRNDTYNNFDQLVSSEFIASSGSERRLNSYTYDGDRKVSYLNTGLFFRGFPKTGRDDHFVQPGPYLNVPGQDDELSNILTANMKYFRKAGTGWGDPLIDRTLRYKHAYYRDRYSLGYDRSDGQRVRYSYTNCE